MPDDRNGLACKYGTNCMFSHDPEVVNAFKSNKICPWGPGCSFRASQTGCSYGINDCADNNVHYSSENGPTGGLSLDALAKSFNGPGYMVEGGEDDAWYLD